MRYINISVRQLLKNYGGFIYIEALVGIVILTVALTFMAGTHRQAIANSVYTDHHTIATAFAKETLEALKAQDNISQTKADTGIFTVPIAKDKIVHGITYTATVATVDLGTTLGRLANEITPVRVTVKWLDKPTDKIEQSLTIAGYYTIQPLFTKANTTPSNKAKQPRYKIYDTHGVSGAKGSGAMQHANSPNDGYFYTTSSKFKRLWDQCYGEIYQELDPIQYDPNDPTKILNPENRAATNNWGASGDIFQFDNLAIPASAAGECDVFAFQVINDGPSYAEYANPTKINRSLWGIPSDYKTPFYFDIYLSSTYDSTMKDNLKDANGDGTVDSNSKYLLVSNAEVVASDKESHGLTADSGTTHKLTLPDPSDKTKTITVTAKVIDGALEIIGLPAGNTYSIGLQWKNDHGNSDTNNVSGTDSNVLISDLSLTKAIKK